MTLMRSRTSKQAPRLTGRVLRGLRRIIDRAAPTLFDGFDAAACGEVERARQWIEAMTHHRMTRKDNAHNGHPEHEAASGGPAVPAE
jgi:hypothetical protein